MKPIPEDITVPDTMGEQFHRVSEPYAFSPLQLLLLPRDQSNMGPAIMNRSCLPRRATPPSGPRGGRSIARTDGGRSIARTDGVDRAFQVDG